MPEPARKPSGPFREPLRDVRRAVLRLHKALIDWERARFERERGSLSNAAFLQELLQNPRFQWLRVHSELIIQVDERLAERDEPVDAAEARAFVERARALLAPDAAPDRYAAAREESGAVRTQHNALERAVERADDALGG